MYARRYFVQTTVEDSTGQLSCDTVWAYDAADAITQTNLRYHGRQPARRVTRVAPAELPPHHWHPREPWIEQSDPDEFHG